MYKKYFLVLLLYLASIRGYAQEVLHAGENDWKEEVDGFTDSQQKIATAGCGTPSFVSTGYPAWTNYYAGWMVNIINTFSCPITINSFEARFQGTTDYRIYTKVGTFVGFEVTSGAWTLVGTAAALTGTSTVAPTAIPIAVNVVIPAGATQAFYLSRSDNLVANRHLYITGAGTAGTTIYASDANLSITEGSYIDPFFAALQVGVRRPSFDVCYTKSCILPFDLMKFSGRNNTDYNLLTWQTASEINSDYFSVESSENGIDWKQIGKVYSNSNSNKSITYEFRDDVPSNKKIYYHLKLVDRDGAYKYSDAIYLEEMNDAIPKLIRVMNYYGQDVDETSKGFVFEMYSDGSVIKRIKE